MAKRKSVPTSAVKRPKQKAVRSNQTTRTELKPVWRFSTVDLAGPFAWPKGTNAELDIVTNLHNFDSMDWGSIEGKNNHYLSTSSLSKDATKRLCEIKLDDAAENLFSFRLAGKTRIIAIKDNNIAKLLWFDPEHLVAPSKKKHT